MSTDTPRPEVPIRIIEFTPGPDHWQLHAHPEGDFRGLRFAGDKGGPGGLGLYAALSHCITAHATTGAWLEVRFYSESFRMFIPKTEDAGGALYSAGQFSKPG